MEAFFFSSSVQLLVLMLWISHNTVCSKESFFTLSYNGMKNSTGDWVDILTAQVAIKKSEEHINVYSTQSIEETGEKRIITIKGITNNLPVALNASIRSEESKGLLFHPQCESNCFITNGRRTVRRIAPGGGKNAAYTNRPLKDDEIFEVKIERREYNRAPSIIGVATIEPPSIKGNITIKEKWIYYQDRLYINDTYTKDYGRSTNDIEEGMTLGVMRTKSGELHFFFDGKGQGLALSNLPPNVYGYFQLFRDGIRATIVNS